MPFKFLLDKDPHGNMLAPKDSNTLVVCAGTISADSVEYMGYGFNYFKNLFGFYGNSTPIWVTTLNNEFSKLISVPIENRINFINPYIRLIEPNPHYNYCGGVATVDMLAVGQDPSDAQKVQYKKAVKLAIIDALVLRKTLYLQPLGIGSYGWSPTLAAQLFFESYNELKREYPGVSSLQIEIPIFDSASNDGIFKAELEALQNQQQATDEHDQVSTPINQQSEKKGMLIPGVEYNIKYKESGVNSKEYTDRLSIKATITHLQAIEIQKIIYKYLNDKCEPQSLFFCIESPGVYENGVYIVPSDNKFSKRTVIISYPSGLLTDVELGNCLNDISSFLGGTTENNLKQQAASTLQKQLPMPSQNFAPPTVTSTINIKELVQYPPGYQAPPRQFVEASVPVPQSQLHTQSGVYYPPGYQAPSRQFVEASVSVPQSQLHTQSGVYYPPGYQASPRQFGGAAPLVPQWQSLQGPIIQPPPGSQASQFQLGAVTPLDNLPPFDLLLIKDQDKLNENRQRISKARQWAYDYFAADAVQRSQYIADTQQRGVRVYLDKGSDKEIIKASCSRSSGYTIPKDSRHLVKSRVIASQSYFVADASGNTFDRPAPAIMLTSCAPNLRSGENPGDLKAYCQPNGRLNAMAYKDEMKRVWTRFLYAANAEAEGQQVEVLTPLAGGGAYLRTLSEEDRLRAQQIIAEALIEAANANSFPNIQSIHFFVVDTDKDRPYAHVEKVFLAHQANYKGKPINLSNADMLMAGQKLATQHRRIILCNPGSDHIPGGGAYADKDDLTKCPKKGMVGPFYGKVHAFEEQLAHYSCFLYAQNLEQNAYYDGNFEKLCKEIPADILGLKAVPSNASSSHPAAVVKEPLPLQSKSNSSLFPHVKFFGDKRKNGQQRNHNGTLCYEIECSVDDERNRLVTLLQQKGIQILSDSYGRVKYGIKTIDGKRDAEELVMELAIKLVANQIASKCNDVDYWKTKVRPGYGVSSGNHKIPHAISQIQQIVKGYQQNRDDGAGLLKSIGELATYKHSTYFQWAHSFFRGRDNQTNKFYGILAQLKGELKAADISKIPVLYLNRALFLGNAYADSYLYFAI